MAFRVVSSKDSGKSCGKEAKGSKSFKSFGGGKNSKIGKSDGASISFGTGVLSSSGRVNCKFFGSAKGCEAGNSCPFSHEDPNSVPPCSHKQRLGSCLKGEVCTFRHTPWASVEHARQHYASRDDKEVELSKARFQQLHRSALGANSPSQPPKVAKEHVELPVEKEVEKEIHEETYGSIAMRMMEKMGYKAGVGLGKDATGSTKLADPCLELERASQIATLGLGTFDPNSKATTAERTARMADARARERKRSIHSVEHNLLSDDELSDAEDVHRVAKHVQL